MKFVSRIISAVFHPLFLPIYGLVAAVYANPSYFDTYPIPVDNTFMIFSINLVLLPLIGLLLLLALGFIKNIAMPDQKLRSIPYIVVMFFYIWGYVLLYRLVGVPPLATVIVLGALIALILLFLGNILIMKISAHTVGMGVLATFLCILYVSGARSGFIWVMIGGVVIAGVVGFARLMLTAHSNREIYFGYLLGIVSQLMAHYYFLKLDLYE